LSDLPDTPNQPFFVNLDNPYRSYVGAPLTNGLFYDSPSTGAPKDKALYTLKDKDTTHNGVKYKSLYRLYMETGDLTEYSFYTKYLDGLEHFEKLCSASFFKPYIERWRKELELRTRAQALRQIVDIAKDSSHKASFSANRFLLAGDWKTPSEAKGRGRPSKADIRAVAQTMAEEEQRLAEDYDRIN
jgi:hypothetical protein